VGSRAGAASAKRTVVAGIPVSRRRSARARCNDISIAEPASGEPPANSWTNRFVANTSARFATGAGNPSFLVAWRWRWRARIKAARTVEHAAKSAPTRARGRRAARACPNMVTPVAQAWRRCRLDVEMRERQRGERFVEIRTDRFYHP
jgi:hypothetical protein